MAEFPALPLWTDSFISDTMHLNAAETGAYMMLLISAWRSPDCCLPNNDKKLARMARCSTREWSKMKDDVLNFWYLENDKWFQKKLVSVRESVILKSKTASQAGKASALKRLKAASTVVDPTLQQDANENPTTKTKTINQSINQCREYQKIFENELNGIAQPIFNFPDSRVQSVDKAHEIFEGDIEKFRALCVKARSTEYIVNTAANKRGLMHLFDWMLIPENITKIMEGGFDKLPERVVTKSNTPIPEPESDEEIKDLAYWKAKAKKEGRTY